MYKYYKNIIEINDKNHVFKYNLRTVIEYKDTYIVLIAVPYGKKEINNIYCLNSKAKIVWQAEDLEKLYVDRKIYPYENIILSKDHIYATDFYGCEYKIDAKTGKVKGYKNIGW